jgi:hypothetical protein
LRLPFLPKPFTASKLRETVRRVLDEEAPRSLRRSGDQGESHEPGGA